jgi:hypothetical protein
MDIDFTIITLFTHHIALLFIKGWFLYIVFKLLILVEAPATEKYMLVFKSIELILFIFCIASLVSEIIFILGFFTEETFYGYEYLSMSSEMLFIYLTGSYIKKEDKDNAN